MAKSKESELEHLRAENRKMKSIIKHLKKEISRTNKRSQQYLDLEEKIKELDDHSSENSFITQTDKCPNCKAEIELVDLGGVRKLIVCKSCGYKKSKKTN